MKFLAKKGFTLVELMVVIVIIGILAAVAIPKFTMASHKARASEFPTILVQVYTSEIANEAESGSFDANWSSIGMDDPALQSKWFSYTITSASYSVFSGAAKVGVTFGGLGVTESATINNSNAKGITAGLAKYATNWK